MGKIRIKTLGIEEIEEEQKKRDEKRRAKKRAKKLKKKGIRPPGGKGGERIKTVGPTPEELEEENQKEIKGKKTSPQVKTKIKKKKPRHKRSKRYQALKKKIDPKTYYSLDKAITLAKETARVAFTASIEAHFTLTKKPKELHLKNQKDLPIAYERKFPLAHAKLGTIKDTDKKLSQVLSQLVKQIGAHNIKKITLASTMGPGIKVKL